MGDFPVGLPSESGQTSVCPIMNSDFLRELMRRRVPQMVGLYLAAGWGLLEFTDWAAGRFGFSGSLEDAVVVSWAILLPVVAILVWKWGAPGPLPLPDPFSDPQTVRWLSSPSST
jgi:hypothetical protein